MEFNCVLSVGGSLASYHVTKESEAVYKAVLRTSNGQRIDIPAEMVLTKNGGDWQAAPLHAEIMQSLVHAIEANGQ